MYVDSCSVIPDCGICQDVRCGATQVGKGSGICFQCHDRGEECCSCPSGKYFDNSLCRKCPVGKYSSSSRLSNSCMQCPEGYVTSVERIVCDECPNGYFENEGHTCESCEEGQYQNNPGTSACKL